MAFGHRIVLTPPIDSHVAQDGLNKIDESISRTNSDSGIFLGSKSEDNVFRRDQTFHPENTSVPLPAAAEVIEYAANNTIAPRPDRLLDPITSSNAQGVLPPDALVFVAKYGISSTA